MSWSRSPAADYRKLRGYKLATNSGRTTVILAKTIRVGRGPNRIAQRHASDQKDDQASCGLAGWLYLTDDIPDSALEAIRLCAAREGPPWSTCAPGPCGAGADAGRAREPSSPARRQGFDEFARLGQAVGLDHHASPTPAQPRARPHHGPVGSSHRVGRSRTFGLEPSSPRRRSTPRRTALCPVDADLPLHYAESTSARCSRKDHRAGALVPSPPWPPLRHLGQRCSGVCSIDVRLSAVGD